MEHEYTLLGGINRAQVGRYIATLASAVSAGAVLLLLTIWDAATAFGLRADVPPVAFALASAGVIYALIYWVFDRYAWRVPWISKALKVPNLAGVWRCKGQTINPDKTLGYEWNATVTIVQSWDRFRVRLKTHQSSSNSRSAALLYDEADGFRLFYNYQNEPKVGEAELQPHLGFAELVFDHDLQSAEGEYFNGRGRYTFGTMHLTREEG